MTARNPCMYLFIYVNRNIFPYVRKLFQLQVLRSTVIVGGRPKQLKLRKPCCGEF
jgi:hypothetical protein